ncbi:MAG: hypothetical protein ACYS99_05705 [Planctomycetota bacterium]|jgi:hypothetical protein
MINPPVGIPQLPPHTEGFSFCHISGTGVDVTNVVVKVKDHTGRKIHDSGNLGPVASGDTLTHAIEVDDGKGQLVIVNLSTTGGNFTYRSDPQPASTYVCFADCGLRPGEDGVVPYGVYILNHGEARAF